MNGKILLIVDTQYDFINGTLPVNDAERAMNNLADFIRGHGKDYEKIILTADWHPTTHCSFKDNGGMWPMHCVQHSHGAAIYQPILDALNEIKADYVVVTKGLNEEHEEYSVFKNEKSHDLIVNLCNYIKPQVINVCGLAYDYCVADSVKDGVKAIPDVNFAVMKEYSPAIAEDTANNFTNFIENSERVWLV